MNTKHKHRKHPLQDDPFYKLSEEEKERYRIEFIELEQHLHRLCVESTLGKPVLERVDPLDYYRDMFPAGSFETCTWEERTDEQDHDCQYWNRPKAERNDLCNQ